MRISELRAKRTRFWVYDDGKYAFSVGEETLIKYKLAVGVELDEEIVSKIIDEDSDKYFSALAFNYVSYSAKTQKQVRDYLLRKGAGERSCDKAISLLLEYGYINDANYSEIYTEQKSSRIGPRAISYRLKAKGVSQEIVDNSVVVSEEVQLEAATKIAKSAKYQGLEPRIKKQRIYAALARRGFDSEIVGKVLSALGKEEEEE